MWTEGDALRDLERGPGSRKRKEALRQLERDELQAQVAARVGEVLDFALAHEQDLRWVSLRGWRYLRALARNGYCAQDGLVDLYFGPFGPAPVGDEADAEHRPAAQIRFEDSFARLDPVAGPVGPHGWRWTRTQQVFFLRNLLHWAPSLVPHPLGAGTLLLRVESVLSNLRHPLFERFEALAQRVESRLSREQMTFC